MVCGTISAAAAPWTARAPISSPVSGAAAQARDASTKAVTPIRKILARPRTSPSRPPVIRKAANGSV